MNNTLRVHAPFKPETTLDYAPGSSERSKLEQALVETAQADIDVPLVINGVEVRTKRTIPVPVPHDHTLKLGAAHMASETEVAAAIDGALKVRKDWANTRWEERAAIFERASDLLADPWRAKLNAVTMLGQSKTAREAEIDAAVELIDFWRFNLRQMSRIYSEQPMSSEGVSNEVDYRGLDGFVYAITPFNFTAIGGNLPTAPAMMGNVSVWKPSQYAMLAAHYVMKILQQAGLPDGVINLVNGDAEQITQQALTHGQLAGLHFTGSTSVFMQLNRQIYSNLDRYRLYPRVVGETGGKNFILAHPSADVEALAVAIVRGAFEFQGQKCSAASRVYVPSSLWPALRERLGDYISSIRVGDTRDFSNFMGAVISEPAWNRHVGAIEEARQSDYAKVEIGGTYDSSKGWFVNPTVLRTEDPMAPCMKVEYFGPITAVYVFEDARFDEMPALVDKANDYGLTGSIFARDRRVIEKVSCELRDCAGNFYINDKPTGSLVGQQPFGGARKSGTNDKAGSMWNLARWISPRSIKETTYPPTDYRYPYMEDTRS